MSNKKTNQFKLSIRHNQQLIQSPVFCGGKADFRDGFQDNYLTVAHFWVQLYEGSGYFFHVKMPGYRRLSLAAATILHFTACCIRLLVSQNPTACIAYLGGSSQLLIRSTGGDHLGVKKTPRPLNYMGKTGSHHFIAD